MPKTSTARSNNFRCPLCGERLSKQDGGRGFVDHIARPSGPSIFDDQEKINEMLASGDLRPNFSQRYEATGRCPFQEGQKDSRTPDESVDLVSRILLNCRNHPLIAWIIVIATVITSIGAVTGALQNIVTFVSQINGR